MKKWMVPAITFLGKLGLIGASLAAFGVIAGLLLATQASAASGSIVVSDATIAPNGGTGNVTVVGNVGEPGLGAWSIEISYDTSVLSVAACVSHPAGFCNPDFDRDGGSLRTNGALAVGAMGDTILATITFECIGGPDTHSPVTVFVHTFADATPGGPLPVDPLSITEGAVWCMETGPPPPPPPPNTNQDVTVLTDEDIAAAELVSLPLDRSGLVVTEDQPNVFAFSLSAGDTVEIDAFFSNPGNIDIGLFDPDNLSVQRSESMNDNEAILHVARKTGMYHLKVALKSGGENPYRLRITRRAGPGPGPSGAEAPPVAAGLPTAGLGGSAGGSASSWALIAAGSAGLAALAATARFVGVRRERDTSWR